jgi:hypothetical protein
MRPPLHDLACAIHVHSTYSDGTGTVPEIAAAGRAAGLDVLMLTDHDSLEAKRRGEEAFYGDLLLLVGEEVSPRRENHFLAFGIDEEIDHSGLSASEIVEAVGAAGGFGFAAHAWSGGNPHFPRFGTGMPWRDFDSPALAGIELWSFLTDTGEKLSGYADVARFVLAPGRVLDHPPQRNVEGWDQLCARRRMVALGGLDSHQIGKRLPGGHVLKFMSYERSFGYLRTHVLSERALSGELAADQAQVFDALRAGRCYIAVDSLAPARGFSFWAERATGDGSAVPMGAEEQADQWVLKASAPRPAELRLIRDGERLASAPSSTSIVHRTEGRPGVYRVEARVVAGGRERTWIMSNPIYLR